MVWVWQLVNPHRSRSSALPTSYSYILLPPDPHTDTDLLVIRHYIFNSCSPFSLSDFHQDERSARPYLVMYHADSSCWIPYRHVTVCTHSAIGISIGPGSFPACSRPTPSVFSPKLSPLLYLLSGLVIGSDTSGKPQSCPDTPSYITGGIRLTWISRWNKIGSCLASYTSIILFTTSPTGEAESASSNGICIR